MIDNLELKQIKNAVNFSNALESRTRENFKELLIWLEDFTKIYTDEKGKLPYHINLIDELHADENAHSRIFAKLLRYKDDKKHTLLEKFLKDVCNFDLCIESPVIGKVDSNGRIDIPIFDKKYTVIIENKVTDKAPDQNNSKGGQLARYIESIGKSEGRKLNGIYVVYTPKYTRPPSCESWVNKEGYSYKNDFKHRFKSLSYRDDIYPWLKNKILPDIDRANIHLHSALEQYVDHLEGLFSLRTINNEMNMILQEFIKEQLNIDDTKPERAVELLQIKETELNNAITQIQLLKTNYNKQIMLNHFVKWENLLRNDFPDFKIIGDKFNFDKNCINIGIKFSIENQNFAALLESNESDKQRVYFGIGKHFASPVKHSLFETLRSILGNSQLKDADNYWYGYKYSSMDNAYENFKGFIDELKLIEKIEVENLNV